MSKKFISIRGAKTHNLKSVDLDLPRDKFIVITGLSGSGKSSLAFDTLYAEGQRRYVESLSSYARQFLSMMDKPEVEHIEGLSPAISIEQKATSHNPRSTVGTVTEIYDYLRLMYARVGTPFCPKHQLPLKAQTISQMVDAVCQLQEGCKIMVLAPIVRNRKGEHLKLFQHFQAEGYVRVRVNGEVYEIGEAPKLNPKQKNTIEVVIDRLKVSADKRQRMAESIENALLQSDGLVGILQMESDAEPTLYSSKYACLECGYSLEELEPRLFSYNSPQGACSECDGLGVTQFVDEKKLIRNERLSLNEGAVCGWREDKNFYYFSLLKSIAKHYKVDLDKPFTKLSKRFKNTLFHGSGESSIPLTFVRMDGRIKERVQPFEGILNNFMRRYRETESNMVRKELVKYLTVQACQSCTGRRLNEAACNVFINEKSLPELCEYAIGPLHQFFKTLSLKGNQGEIAEKINKEIVERLGFLVNVGLEYLTLSRGADTLSGGEAQRIRLASQIGSGLVGVMYILDEPSIGLHQRDNDRLLKTLLHLRDLGNAVIVVEHDEDAIRASDYIVDIGPGAGKHGGEVVAAGPLTKIIKTKKSLTAKYLTGELTIEMPTMRRPIDKERVITLEGASGNNLKNVNLTIPLGLITCVTGVSGSGKSTLINDTFYPAVASQLMLDCKPFECISGEEQIDKVIDISQSPIGRTPRSNPATYTGVFSDIRELFSGTVTARARGYKPGRFSFNVKGGRCEACQGAGVIKVEMHFLPDAYVVCDVCSGRRYNRETLEVQYKGKTIEDVLAMTVEEAKAFFDAIPSIANVLQTLLDVGLSYITLGQNATTLSGGEAQRVKLAKELSKRATGSTLYILDEPTTGLHFHDIKQLLSVLKRLNESGNTIVIIEHNLDVVKFADWIVDLGPEGGEKGGEIIFEGTPEAISKCKRSHTGKFLKKHLL
jgi:excinuclease ABC subunit A